MSLRRWIINALLREGEAFIGPAPKDTHDYLFGMEPVIEHPTYTPGWTKLLPKWGTRERKRKEKGRWCAPGTTISPFAPSCRQADRAPH